MQAFGPQRVLDRRIWFIVLLLVLAAGLVLRLWGLGVESLTHPEIYIPGIPLPEGISEPPPRHTLAQVLDWHFHDEPHPVGYYLAMFGWTELFGTTEWALRLPGALLGAASVLLICLVGARAWNPGVGLLGAAMLALHGLHIYWSHQARMYVPAAFLVLLSTWFLIAATDAARRRPWHEAGYVLSLTAGLHTTELVWVVFGMHLAWSAFAVRQDRAAMARPLSAGWLWTGFRLSQLHGLVVALGAPEMAHALYRARGGATDPATLTFIRDFLGFGSLLARDELSIPERITNPVLAWTAVAATLVLVAAAFRAKTRTVVVAEERPLPGWLRVGVALICSALVLWLAAIAHGRNLPMAAVAVFPLLALAIPGAVVIAARLVGALGPLARIDPMLLLFLLTGLVAPLAVYAISFKVALAADRAFLVFLPSLLLLCAAGLSVLLQRRLTAVIAGAAVAGFFAWGLVYNARRPQSGNDYKGLAAQMQAAMQPGDLVLVRRRDWITTPLLYYLPDARLVAEDWSAAATAADRVWIIVWGQQGQEIRPPSIAAAVAGRTPAESVTARRGRAELYLRTP